MNQSVLVVEENNCTNKIANAYIAYCLDKLLNNSTLKNCLFGSTNIIRSKYVYSGYGIAFDGAGSWNFGNNFARNFVIFDIDIMAKIIPKIIS